MTKQISDDNQANLENKIKFPFAIDLHKRFVAEVKPLLPLGATKSAPQQALRDLRLAWNRCFKKISKRPKFKKKRVKDGFYLDGSIKVESRRMKLPKIGWVKTYESLTSSNQMKNVRITRQVDRWFVTFNIE